MRITIDNIPQVLGAPPDQLPDILSKVFEKLVKPNQNETFIRCYCVRFYYCCILETFC
jgi:hypothetical protein